MAEKMTKANLFGSEYSLVGKSSGGGGAGMGVTTSNRWLRFNFNDPNHKSLRILGGTSFLIGNDLVEFEEDFIVDFSSYISEEGCDYYVFLNKDKNIVCGTLRDVPEGYIFIGQFHTLCADVGDNVTGILSTAFNSVGMNITLQNYDELKDLDFYNFYTKKIISIDTGLKYNVATIQHPLSGFKARDILPESVWCLNFHPSCKNWDGMVYCNALNIAADIYVQSGTGEYTSSTYGATYVLFREFQNHISDANLVGKHQLTYDIFTYIAQGGVEHNRVSEFLYTTGGHKDMLNRRLISFIGCEDCTGFIAYYSGNVIGTIEGDWQATDGQGSFGWTDDAEGMRCLIIGGGIGGGIPTLIDDLSLIGSRLMNNGHHINLTEYLSSRCWTNIAVV